MSTKGKKDNSNEACGFCGSQEEILRPCSRCKLVFYCGVECQKAHWLKDGGHKKFCVSVEQRKPGKQTPPPPKTKLSKDCEKCAICLDVIISKKDSCELPCSHIFHTCCMEEFRSYAAAQEENSRCPLCRDDLDSSLKSQFLKGCKLYDEIKRKKELKFVVGPTDHEDMDKSMKEFSKGERQVIKLWEKCAKAGFLPAKNALEKVQFDTKREQSHTEMYISLAFSGNIMAQTQLGQCYFLGQEGFAKDNKKAKFWFKKAPDQGASQGQYCYGMCLSGGYGGPRDLKEGFKYFEMSAAQGNPNAYNDIGCAYRDGTGAVKQNKKTAEKWFKKAAMQGHISGCFLLAKLYHESGEYKKAFPWFQKAAEMGEPPAQWTLGFDYYLGGLGGVDISEESAFKWIRSAAKLGHSQAMNFNDFAGRGKIPEKKPTPTAPRFL